MALIDEITQLRDDSLSSLDASHDYYVHTKNVWVDKSKGCARFADGDKLELPEHYHRDSWQLIRQVVTDVANAAINKLGN